MSVEPYYTDDYVTLYHGDALDILPTLRAGAVDLVVTDPPYIIGSSSIGKEQSKAGQWADVMNSSRWFRDWYVMVKRLLASHGAMWTFCNWRSLPVVIKAGGDAGWGVTSVLVWDKEWIGPGGHQGLRPSYELVAMMAMPEFTIDDRALPDIWRSKWASHKPTGHPAEKPVALLARILAVSDCENILDPFAGSGSTLVAAKSQGRPVVGIEANERWCEVAAKRLSQEVLMPPARDWHDSTIPGDGGFVPGTWIRSR